jgi:hypothetical protein
MPRGDRTGPEGLGPMTGRARGYCAGYPVAGFANRGTGMGFGGGYGWSRGRGRVGGGGWRNRYRLRDPGWWDWSRVGFGSPMVSPSVPFAYYAFATKEQQLDRLKRQAEYVEHVLKDLQNQIKNIESAAQDTKEQ